MTRHEFDQAFKPMVAALGVKMNAAQADFFFNEYRRHHAADFAHACTELAMGNPGWLPKPDLFRDYVAAAREMRIANDSALRDRQAQNFLHVVGDRTGPMDDLFAKCCVRRIMGDVKDAVAFMEDALANPEFSQWLSSWRTKSGMVALAWFKEQMELKRKSQGVGRPMRHLVSL